MTTKMNYNQIAACQSTIETWEDGPRSYRSSSNYKKVRILGPASRIMGS